MKSKKKSKKDLFVLLSLPLILAFFLMIVFFIQSARFQGETVLDEARSFTISVRDGKAEPASHAFIVPITRQGLYNYVITWDVKDPGFATGCVVKTPDGETLSAFHAYQVTAENNQFTCDAGKHEVELFFLTDKERMEDFEKNYFGYREGASSDYFVNQFDSLSQPLSDRDLTFTVSLKVTEAKAAPAALQILTVALGLLILIALFACLAKEPGSADTLKERLDEMGYRYGIILMTIITAQMLIIVMLRNLAPDFANAHNVFLSLLLTIISVDVIGFPVAYLVCRGVPKETIPKKKMSLGKFLLFALMSAGICGVGGVLGNLVHNLITLPVGGGDTAISMLMLNSGVGMRVLSIGILAPIFEELIFRKLLVDRMIKHGEFITILTSGLFFGLFHGNFQQFFFAFGLGLLWAFVYARTGKIGYTIAMHMLINMSTSAITVILYGKYLEYAPGSTDSAAVSAAMQASPEAYLYTMLYGLWNILIILIAIIGIVLLIVFFAKKKFRLRRLEGEVSRGEAIKALFTSKYVWLFLLGCIGLFFTSYLPLFL